MSKYEITYTVDAENISQASEIAYSHVYLADVEVDKVEIRPAERGDNPEYLTYGETAPKAAERIVGRYNPNLPITFDSGLQVNPNGRS